METDVLAAARSTSPDAGEERHHAVIVFADVVGYSRLTADDEPGTLNRWTALYRNVLKPDAERRGSHVGDLRGDGILLEFKHVADALAWSRLAHPAAGRPASQTRPRSRCGWRSIRARYSSTREGLFGDAVNVVARPQQHATPDGTVISDSVKDALETWPKSSSGSSGTRTSPPAVCRKPSAGCVSAATRIRATPPSCGIAPRLFVELGHLAEARVVAEDMMRLESELRLKTFARRRQPFRQPETGAANLEGLRAAG